ncbi:hypothetical protein RND71_003588 [Anisodus tanguticus]|uniref:Uncharacterized protein n=1 Tax=Anisodus tanguticus TaxID=243964 RepID=A0AAE1SW76_9SOLA|nr:hypothetical protein RND71_003588 [Anisodus tanguticus]
MNVGDANSIGNNNIIEDKEKAREKNISNAEEQSNNIHKAKNEVIPNEIYKLRRKRGRKSKKEISEGERQSIAINKTVTRKVCTEWIVDLHAKFMEVVNVVAIIGELQKSKNFIVSDQVKYLQSGYQQRSSFRKYEIMPRLQTNIPIQQQQCNPDQTQRDPEFLFSTHNTNIFARGETSTLQQPYISQLQIQPHYIRIDNPFNNLFLLDQSNAGDGLGQQYGSLFEILGSQELQDPTIERTNYRLGLTFNNGDHHTQND